MKLYEISLQPISPVATPLKGDTLFGQVCWQATEDPSLLEGGLEEQLRHYEERPFAVFSSAYPRIVGPDGTVSYAFKRPDLPLEMLSRLSGGKLSCDVLQAKEQKARRWMIVPGDLELNPEHMQFLTDAELIQSVRAGHPAETLVDVPTYSPPAFSARFVQAHNTINRLTFTTGTGPFAPYTQQAIVYSPGVELAVFVVIDEAATDIYRMREALHRIGKWGFGKDASIGYGRYIVPDWREVARPSCEGVEAMYTLGPCVPQPGSFTESFFVPFVRFGKHGSELARHANPFKNPVIMADEGAVFVPASREAFASPYFGRPARNVSKAQKEAIVQGYTPYLPLRLEN
ncbi:MAG: hypothetical protein AB1733_14365 [Thermodesulfobacteriota bacterium]